MACSCYHDKSNGDGTSVSIIHLPRSTNDTLAPTLARYVDPELTGNASTAFALRIGSTPPTVAALLVFIPKMVSLMLVRWATGHKHFAQESLARVYNHCTITTFRMALWWLSYSIGNRQAPNCIGGKHKYAKAILSFLGLCCSEAFR